MSKTVVTTTINRTYLKNKTKDEIIDLLLYILDTRCEADAKIETQAAEIERLRKAAIEWVQAPCTSPTCRGLKNGSPFMVTCEKGRENQAVCNECFCK